MAAGTTAKVNYGSSWYIDVKLSRVPNSERTLMATWSCNWKAVAKYEIFWRYWLPNGKYIDQISSVSQVAGLADYQNTFDYPENATKIQVWVRPHESSDAPSSDSKWKYLCPWSPKKPLWTYAKEYQTPKDVSTPNAEIENYKITITATVDAIETDTNTKQIQFYIIDENDKVVSQPRVNVNRISAMAKYVFNSTAGKKYRVRARGYNNSANIYGKWSEYSSEVESPPSEVSITSISSLSLTSVRLKWTKALTAKKFEINYTSEPNDFDKESGGSRETFTTLSGDITGLETGKTWYFRIRSVNDSGESGWSDIKSVVLGIKPSPPTTWSNLVTAKIGEKITLNWTHNSRDNSAMKNSQIEIAVNDSTQVIDVPGKIDSDTMEYINTGVYDVDTSSYKDNSSIKWRVRTKGVFDDYSDWSITREIKIYAPATLVVATYSTQNVSEETLIESVESFPFYILASAGPVSQRAIGFNISITSDESYQTVNSLGETVWINANEQIYSRYFDFDSTVNKVEFGDYATVQNNELLLKIMPNDIDLESGQSYSIHATVAMNTGLIAEATNTFSVNIIDEEMYPLADVVVSLEDYTAIVIPYCPVNYSPDEMEQLPNGQDDRNIPLVENVTLSVYRIEYDGKMVELMANIPNDRSTAVIDPHPPLDYARYRIVCVSTTTGATSFRDIEPVKIGETGIVIQWDETWKNLYTNPLNGDLESAAGWSGSRLILPANIDTTEGNSIDKSLVEYAGRKHPISYYGTQVGTSATWNAEFPKSDSDTLTKLRKLSSYSGNVYVREPKGVGYWASIEVSYNIQHLNLIIPVTLTITRVEGGV